MIEVVQMPVEPNRFACVLDSMELRRDSFLNENTWIGQSANRVGALEDCDREDSFHVVNREGNETIGYARLVPVRQRDDDETVSGTIADLAQKSNRCPAFELQCVSFVDDSDGANVSEHGGGSDDGSAGREIILRELIIETMRISNNRQCRFIYTTSDRGGTALLKKIGLRYSTLSAPFPVQDRLMVILCIPVTNSNILAVSPLRVVGGTEVPNPHRMRVDAQASSPETPSDFGRLEALANLTDSCDDPT